MLNLVRGWLPSPDRVRRTDHPREQARYPEFKEDAAFIKDRAEKWMAERRRHQRGAVERDE
eukprot:422699-Pleurochrysis_carterae.AAC.1